MKDRQAGAQKQNSGAEICQKSSFISQVGSFNGKLILKN